MVILLAMFAARLKPSIRRIDRRRALPFKTFIEGVLKHSPFFLVRRGLPAFVRGHVSARLVMAVDWELGPVVLEKPPREKPLGPMLGS